MSQTVKQGQGRMMAKEKKTSAINNIETNKKGGFVLVSVNPKVYPLDIVYSAAYAMMDKAWVIIDGNPSEELVLELRPKQKTKLEELGRTFNEELLNYGFYKTMAQQNKGVREAFLKMAFFTNAQEGHAETQQENCKIGGLSYTEDPLGIAKPWSPEKEKPDKSSE